MCQYWICHGQTRNSFGKFILRLFYCWIMQIFQVYSFPSGSKDLIFHLPLHLYSRLVTNNFRHTLYQAHGCDYLYVASIYFHPSIWMFQQRYHCKICGLLYISLYVLCLLSTTLGIMIFDISHSARLNFPQF